MNEKSTTEESKAPVAIEVESAFLPRTIESMVAMTGELTQAQHALLIITEASGDEDTPFVRHKVLAMGGYLTDTKEKSEEVLKSTLGSILDAVTDGDDITSVRYPDRQTDES